MIKQVIKTKKVRVFDERCGYFRQIYCTYGWLEKDGKILDDSYFETRSPFIEDLSGMEEVIIRELRRVAGAA